jgi:cation diffusion facilitator family transporter
LKDKRTMDTLDTTLTVQKEKSSAALTSVIAAFALTVFKIVVGIFTGSLGILAEAAHSGLDLAAALVTLLAVKKSDRPADSEHNFGHGKIENLSALFETLLLLVTCVWIVYEAVQRLFIKSVEIELSIWAYIVMVISIIVCVYNSRMLIKTAKKHNSQALEADGLHFSTDVWSSGVVLFGLICVFIAEKFEGLKFLHKADSIAALIVALIVVYVSVELGIRTIKGLLDTAPKGLREKIEKIIMEVPNVLDCHDLRLRTSGSVVFVDAHVQMSSEITLEMAHDLTEIIEAKIREIAPNADVTIHAEPFDQKVDN